MLKAVMLVVLIALLVAPDTTVLAQAHDEDTALQDRPRRRPQRRPPPAAEEKPAKETEAADEADEEVIENDDDYLAITGGIVHPVVGPDLAGATVLCKNGTIVAVGRNVTVPEGAEVIDASGLHVYPGLLAVRSTGILEGQNVFGFNMTLGLAAGITTALTGNDVAKLTFGTLEDHAVRSGAFVPLSYDSRNPQGRRRLRASFDRLRQYQRDLADYEAKKGDDPELKKPDDRWIRGEAANHFRLLKGEATAIMNVGDAHGLLQACELGEQYGIDIVVQGAYEAWTVAEHLGRAGIDAIVSPRESVSPNENLVRENGSSIQNAAILRRHGVNVAVVPAGGLFGPGYQISLGGLAGRDLLHLPMAAAFAVRGGLSNDDAIRTITIDAARILGVDHLVGSIEVGKDADFAITDGDLLHYMTHVNLTVVNGRIAYDKSKDTLFSHIRPAADPEAGPPDDYWPRRLGDGMD